MRLLAISGSLRGASYNTKLLRAAATQLPPGVDLTVLDPEVLRAIPAYDEDHEHGALPAPLAVAQLRSAIAAADGVLFATPEYNGSIPGALKNALDWMSRPLATSPLKGKPVAVIGSSRGMFGAVWAQAELRKVLQTIGASVVDRELPVGHSDEQFDERDGLIDEGLRAALDAHLGELIANAAPDAVAA